MAWDSAPPGMMDKEMKALQEEFAELLVERKQHIENLLRTMGEGEDAEGILKDLKIVVHKLAGSSAMYSYGDLGEIARECQQRLIHEGHRLTSDSEVLKRTMGRLLEALRESIETGPDGSL